MRTSPQGRALIEAFEGMSLTAYHDEVGVLTIGYGHTNLAGVPPVVKPGMKITAAQADAILADDLTAVEKDVERLIRAPMTQGEFDAFVSFHFNTGCLGKGTVDDKFNSGRKAAAIATLLQYRMAGGRIYNGLIRRREAEMLLFEGKTEAALDKAEAKWTSQASSAPITVKKKRA